MKIIDGLKLEGWQVEIPDCGRNDLPEFFKEMGYTVGVEIGVWKGDFGKILAQDGLKVYGVDPYESYGDLTVLYGGQKQLTKDYDIATETLKGLDYTILKKTSMDAVKDFADESIDFVYIDGNHSFKYFTEDLWEWSKKVKKGGTISGHDYIHLGGPGSCDVKYVLDAYTKCWKIPKWYILGKRYEGKRDKSRSWFWINS